MGEADRSAFKTTAYVADVEIEGRARPVFITIEWDGKRLSISGVEGPRADGDCWGSCGQIEMHGWEAYTARPGFDLDRLREVWSAWHLNDMRAACPHQRAAGWGSETLEVVTYRLSSEGHRLRKEAEEETKRAGIAGEVARLTDAGRLMVGPDWFRDRFTPPDADSPLSGLYEVKKREQKASGWVNENEHPRGVLSKPCPECGYKYGSAWLTEEVPGEILDYLRAIPSGAALCPTSWLR
jgi:hypothetical protein